MKFARKAKVVSVIPTASMADISFLLLVFFYGLDGFRAL